MAKLTQTDEFQRVVELGTERGYLSFEDLQEMLPSQALKPSKLGTLFAYLKDKHSIDVVDIPVHLVGGKDKPALRKPLENVLHINKW